MTLATLFTAAAALTLKGLYNVSIDRARVRRPFFAPRASHLGADRQNIRIRPCYRERE